MSLESPSQLIALIETHIGCWKQFNYLVHAAHAKMFGPEEEFHFAELKKIIARDSETIFACIGDQSAVKTEAAALLGRALSVRQLSELGGGDLHGIEDAWHRIYIGWHSILGRIKIKQCKGENLFIGGGK